MTPLVLLAIAVGLLAGSLARRPQGGVSRRGAVGRTEVFPVNAQSLRHVQGLAHDYLAAESLSPQVRALASRIFASYGVCKSSPGLEKAQTLHRYVCDVVPFIDDPKGFERMVSPAEMSHLLLTRPLGTIGGDCDDKAVLLAALARSAGVNATVVFLDTDGDGEIDHAMTVFMIRGRPVYGETTVPGTQLGWVPFSGQVETLLVTEEPFRK